jgi:hypothetical protein
MDSKRMGNDVCLAWPAAELAVMGAGQAAAILQRRATPEERRLTLLPFFWGTLAPAGVVLGNVTKNSSVQVTNRYRVSYPGYSELLTGRAQDDVIRGNDPVQNPTPSFLQFARQRMKLGQEKIAVFGPWDMFHYIAESHRGDIFVNAGYENSPVPAGNRQQEQGDRDS